MDETAPSFIRCFQIRNDTYVLLLWYKHHGDDLDVGLCHLNQKNTFCHDKPEQYVKGFFSEGDFLTSSTRAWFQEIADNLLQLVCESHCFTMALFSRLVTASSLVAICLIASCSADPRGDCTNECQARHGNPPCYTRNPWTIGTCYQEYYGCWSPCQSLTFSYNDLLPDEPPQDPNLGAKGPKGYGPCRHTEADYCWNAQVSQHQIGGWSLV